MKGKIIETEVVNTLNFKRKSRTEYIVFFKNKNLGSLEMEDDGYFNWNQNKSLNGYLNSNTLLEIALKLIEINSPMEDKLFDELIRNRVEIVENCRLADEDSSDW